MIGAKIMAMSLVNFPWPIVHLMSQNDENPILSPDQIVRKSMTQTLIYSYNLIAYKYVNTHTEERNNFCVTETSM